ncbi:MAG: S-formylglutathione hydrolase, partial [Proteobacteria bacterium]|nr:S-formylglutathione hydrolase [Pseudomonadota bacterium]
MTSIETVSQARSHGGVQGVYRHRSAACSCDMTFAVFVPPQAENGPCPVLWYLSGLTCTHANVMEKGEYRRRAAELGLIVVCPDTSPRGDDVHDIADDWQIGSGAGFYVDATAEPWAANYRMESYILQDLSEAVFGDFPADRSRQGIFG